MAEESQRYHAAFQVEIRYRGYLRPEDKRPAKERGATAGNDLPLRGRVEDIGRGLERRLSPSNPFFLGNSFFKGTRLRVRTAFLVVPFVITYFLGLTYAILRAGTYFGLEAYGLLVLCAVVFGIFATRDRTKLGRPFSYSSTYREYSSWLSGLRFF